MSHQLGSARNNIVASDLIEERKNIDFDQQEMKVYLNGGQDPYNMKMHYHSIFNKHPELHNHHKFYEMTPHEQ